MSGIEQAPVNGASSRRHVSAEPARPAPPTCRVETDFSAMEAAREQWDACVEAMGGSVYLSFDWIKTWWAFYGGDRPLRLFVFEQNGRFVAVLPIFLESFRIGPAKAVTARVVGMHFPPRVLDSRAHATFTRDMFETVIRRLFVDDRCDLLSLGYVTEHWAARAALQAACEACPEVVAPARYARRGVVTWFHLPETFDAYLASLGGAERKKRRKRLRNLNEAHAIRTEVSSRPDRMAGELEQFIEQHTAQWQARGRGGHFTAWPHGRDYHRAQVRAHAPLGRLRFYKLIADGEVVANRYTYLFGDTLHSELPSRAIGGEWDRLGIGSCAMLKFIEAAIGDGVTRIDTGMGNFEHKVRLGGQEVPVGVWRIAGRRCASRIRARVLQRTAQVIRAIFHKLWWRRIVPRLPGTIGRGQRMFWLRWDV